ARCGAAAACGALHGAGGSRSGATAVRGRIQRDDVARGGCGNIDSAGWKGRIGGVVGGDEEDFRDYRHQKRFNFGGSADRFGLRGASSIIWIWSERGSNRFAASERSRSGFNTH